MDRSLRGAIRDLKHGWNLDSVSVLACPCSWLFVVSARHAHQLLGWDTYTHTYRFSKTILLSCCSSFRLQRWPSATWSSFYAATKSYDLSSQKRQFYTTLKSFSEIDWEQGENLPVRAEACFPASWLRVWMNKEEQNVIYRSIEELLKRSHLLFLARNWVICPDINRAAG